MTHPLDHDDELVGEDRKHSMYLALVEMLVDVVSMDEDMDIVELVP